MALRKKVNQDIEAELLWKSRRRCALCFGLYRDFQVKKGQIAHIDRNRTNSSINNLVFLCFDHHDEYDGKTSQSKGITSKELIRYTTELQNHINEWELQLNNLHQDRNQNKNDSYDEFIVYQIVNKNSISGYEFLAINKLQNICISFSDSHVALQEVYWEIRQWLNCDYEKNGTTFHFKLSNLDKLVANELLEAKYALTCYFKRNKVYNIAFAFNTGNQYYEVEFERNAQEFIKVTNNGYQRSIERVNENLENPSLFFEKVSDLLFELKNKSLKGEKHNK